MAHLIKDPKGETVMDNSTVGKPMQHVGIEAVIKTETTITQEEVAQLKQRASELEKEIARVRNYRYDFEC